MSTQSKINTGLLIAILVAIVASVVVPTMVNKPVTVVEEKYLLLICVDGDCYDEREYITDQITLTEAIKKYGHPQWMHELNYDPNSPLPHGDE